MNIAFYAPLKSPDHPVPSGDRQMARLLIEALKRAGHKIQIASHLRSYLSEPAADAMAELEKKAWAEVERIATDWRGTGAPDQWFCYHPYYKAPDLIGTALAPLFGIPYITAEASYSDRRNAGVWARTQAGVVASVKQANINFCFTRRDRNGLASVAPGARLDMLPPFIDTAPFAAAAAQDNASRLVTIAMMRSGDKFDSFKLLAEALSFILDLPWTLTVIGDGVMRREIVALFSAIPAGRIEWLGEVDPDRMPDHLKSGGTYVWPGFGEAYGLAYLEAQAAGLPVVAQNTAGVPEVVQNGVTGLLTPPGDAGAFAAAIRELLTNQGHRRRLASAARGFVLGERSLQQAADLLGAKLAMLEG
jgi:glycosyltransferase involved in cell wall biosynthesis